MHVEAKSAERGLELPEPMQAVMVTWDGGSNRQPFESLCTGLRAHDIGVHVLSNGAHRPIYESLGASFESLPVGDKAPGFRPTVAGERARVTALWLSLEVAEAVVAVLRTRPWDVAIVDASLLSAFAGCEAAGVPFVVVHHSLPGATWSGPRRDQFEAFVAPVNEVRRSLGLQPAGGFGDLMSKACAHIVPTAAEFDTPGPWALPFDYVGPLQPGAPTTGTLPELPDRFVLVSFSTTWQRQIEVLQQTIDALAPLDRAVVMTTGPSVDPSELSPAANTIVVAELPHRLVLDRAEAVVTHAGHGTVLSALTMGVPLVCMPMGRDQHDVAGRVVAIGAGVSLDVGEARRDLLPAVRQVLDQPRFRDAAAAMARSIAGHGGLEAAVAVVERCSRRRPI